jgi:hypothetical protein
MQGGVTKGCREEDANPKGMWRTGQSYLGEGQDGTRRGTPEREGASENAQTYQWGHKRKGRNGSVPGGGTETGNVETTGGIIPESVPEQDNGEQSRLIYYLVCCFIIILIYILCLIYILISNLYLIPVSVYK